MYCLFLKGRLDKLRLLPTQIMKKHSHTLAVIGAASQSTILIGFGLMLWRWSEAISAIDLGSDDQQRVMASIGKVTEQMSHAADLVLWAFGIAMLGLGLFVVAITKFNYRRKWAFWFACLRRFSTSFVPLCTAGWPLPADLCTDPSD